MTRDNDIARDGQGAPDDLMALAAFPSPDERDALGNGIREGSRGMALRDWFAGNVLPAIVSATSAGQHMPGTGYSDDRDIRDRMAEDAYKLADAMIRARAIQSGVASS